MKSIKIPNLTGGELMFNGKVIKSIKNIDSNETVIEFTDETKLSISTYRYDDEYETEYYINLENTDEWINVDKNKL
jgi:hypothetical protein